MKRKTSWKKLTDIKGLGINFRVLFCILTRGVLCDILCYIKCSRKNPDDSYRDIVHPINSQFRVTLEQAVIDAYNEALENQTLEVEGEDEDPSEF